MDALVKDLAKLTSIKDTTVTADDRIEIAEDALHEQLLQLVVQGDIPQSQGERKLLWPLLICPQSISSEEYFQLVARGKCSPQDYEQIRRDAYRTVGSAEEHLPEEKKLIRILSAFTHKHGLKYTQHMSSVAALFASVCSEAIAFSLFERLVVCSMPTYWQTHAPGAKAGALLAEQCLQYTDNSLSQLFMESSYSVESCVNAWFMRLLSHLSPVGDIYRLWDYLFVGGMHRSVYVVVAIVVSLKSVLQERVRVKDIAGRQRGKLSSVLGGSGADDELEELLEDDALLKSPLELFGEQTMMKTKLEARVIIPLAHSLSESRSIPRDIHNAVLRHISDDAMVQFVLAKYSQ